MNEQPPGRILPHDPDAEMGILGSIMQVWEPSSRVMDECCDRLTPSHFYIPAHQTIYSALLRMHEARKPIDLITLTNFLRDDGQLENVGGAVYVTGLFSFVPTAANSDYYIDIVRRKHIRRQIIAECTGLITQAFEDNDDENQLLDYTQGRITALAMDSIREDSMRDIGLAIERYLEKIDNAFHHRGQAVVEGLSTGFIDLDRMLSGMKPQQVITIAGMTSQGKTALATNIAQHVAFDQHQPVGLWSMEMSYEEEGDRICAGLADIPLQRLRDGFLSREEHEQAGARLGLALAAKEWFYIDDERGLTIQQFSARVRREVKRRNLKLVIADHLQFLSSPSKRSQDSRAREISEITYGIKGLAKELRIPFILISHVSREADKRASVFRRPKLSDLKESSSIEQDSDVVLFVWRPGRFAETDEDRVRLARNLRLQFDEGDTADRDRQINEYAEIVVAKQRNGPVGNIRMRFESDITKFQNVTQKSWSNRQDERQQTADDI